MGKRTAHFEVIVYIPLYEQRRQEVDVAVALTVGLAGEVFVGIVGASRIGKVGVLYAKSGHQFHVFCQFLVEAEVAGSHGFAGVEVSGKFFLHLFFLKEGSVVQV